MDRITEIVTVDIDRDCRPRPVYLVWLGTNGGVNQWLFHTNQQVGETIEAGEIFNPAINDIENDRSTSEYLSKTAKPQLIIGAQNIPVEKIQGIPGFPGLRGLLRAIKVEMLTNPDTWESEGPKWQTVKVLPGSFKLGDTRDNKSSIELTIELNEIFIQQQ